MVEPGGKLILLKSEMGKRGGAEKYAWRLAQAFRQQGKAVTLLTSGSTPPFSDDPLLTIVCCPKRAQLSCKKVLIYDRFCENFLQQNPSPVVFGLDRNRFQTHLRASNGVHAAYLEHRAHSEGALKALTFRLNPLHRLLLKIEKDSFEHPRLQKLFVNSHMVKNEILHHYTVDPAKISVVHNGVEWHEYQDSFDCWQQERERLCRDLRLNSSHFHFLFAGHNYHRKGLVQLLQGFAALDSSTAHLMVVGKEKRMRVFYKLIKQLKLEGRVSLYGPTRDLLPFYQIADCLAIPSVYDPFANVTVEALAMGLFVVSAKTNGAAEILDTTTGSVISSLYDPLSVAAALSTALKHPKTAHSAHQIRCSVKHLDFALQLRAFTESL